MSSRKSFPYTTFTTSTGDPLSGGYILIYLSDDAKAPDGLICRGMTLQVSLDINGVVVYTPQVWPNDVISPSGTYYVVSAYSASGALTLGPEKVQVTST